MLRQKAECFFWYRPTRVVPEQRPLNGCCCVVVVVNTLSNAYPIAVSHFVLLPMDTINDTDDEYDDDKH